MKKFGKILAAITMCAIMLPLTACGDKESSTASIGGAGTSAPSQSAAVSAPTVGGAASSAPDDNSTASTPSSDNNSEAGTTSDGGSEAAGAFTHGSVTASSYSNSFLGLGISFDADWVMTTDAELATLNGIADMSAENIEKAFGRSGTIQEMMATKGDTGTSTNIVVQNTLNTGSMTEDQYFTAGIELLKTQLEATGVSVVVNADTATFLGSSMRAIYVEMSAEGTTVYMYQVPIFMDNFIISVTVGSLNKADLPGLLAMYTAA